MKSIVNSTWRSRLDEREGRALWIAPWHVDDATHLLMNNRRWCTLVQRVSPDLQHYDQEVINAGDDYEGLAARRPDRPRSTSGG